MQRFYILPLEVNGAYRGPKYFDGWRGDPSPGGLVCHWSLFDYGLINACLIWADVTTEQHNALIAHNDVAAAPANIDQNISEGAIPQVQAVMEALRIPADWVTTEYTYRQILRMIAQLFMFAGRHHALHGEALIDSPDQLNLRWNQIPLARRQRIIETADSLGYDYAEVQPTWQIRRILKHMADQWGDIPIYMGGYQL
jgi:hypothetical protein